MTILPILKAPHPVLKTKVLPVDKVDDIIRKQVEDMFDTMYDDSGVGLAAPQVGISNRVLVLDVEQFTAEGEPSEKGNPIAFINPEILESSEETNIHNEGCLSLPGMYADIERPKVIRLKYLDIDGKTQTIDADGLLSTCIQHEIDHLDGVLFVDHLSNLKRNMIMKKLQKIKKLEESA